MQVRNPKYNRHGTIDCEILTEKHGWVPFTASPDDSSENGRNIHAECISGKHGEIAEYIPPPPPTREEIEAENQAMRNDEILRDVMPLYLEAQAGLKGESEWKAKMLEIDQKYKNKNENEKETLHDQK